MAGSIPITVAMLIAKYRKNVPLMPTVIRAAKRSRLVSAEYRQKPMIRV